VRGGLRLRGSPARGSSRSTYDVDGQSVGSASGGAVGARSRRGLYRGEAVDPQKKKSSCLDLKTRRKRILGTD